MCTTSRVSFRTAPTGIAPVTKTWEEVVENERRSGAKRFTFSLTSAARRARKQIALDPGKNSGVLNGSLDTSNSASASLLRSKLETQVSSECPWSATGVSAAQQGRGQCGATGRETRAGGRVPWTLRWIRGARKTVSRGASKPVGVGWTLLQPAISSRSWRR
jgi:hypothetical protein